MNHSQKKDLIIYNSQVSSKFYIEEHDTKQHIEYYSESSNKRFLNHLFLRRKDYINNIRTTINKHKIAKKRNLLQLYGVKHFETLQVISHANSNLNENLSIHKKSKSKSKSKIIDEIK